jgi:hypothetical protein
LSSESLKYKINSNIFSPRIAKKILGHKIICKSLGSDWRRLYDGDGYDE